MALQFTPEQQKVIDLHHRNVLVSAAAGSGKTAVLVERIVKMISNESEPIDIDRLLVVTFTNAAAAEMRERISVAITSKLEENPTSSHLQRQAALVHNAQITTIDSFCLFVIRNNFNDIGLDPSFRVADEGEMKLLQQEVLKELFEEKFSLKNEEGKKFCHCVECYAPGGKEKVLEDLILEIYRFAMSYPWPEEWLTDRMQDYELHSLEEFEKKDWVKFALFNLRSRVKDLAEHYSEAIRICEEPDGPYMYGELLEKEQEALEKILSTDSFQQLGLRLEAIRFERLSAKKDDSVSKAKREQVKILRNQVKDRVKGIYQKYFQTPLDLVIKQSQYCELALRELLSLCLEFKRSLDQKKREQNIVDFADMEHFALDILLKKTVNGVEATRTAKDYRSYFAEILIDEYQDSNLVQEYLLQSVSGEAEERFNRFMVGDLKQSIYKFRLARPELFLEKYKTYTLEESRCQRIDLHKNFRSRKEVIESVNYIFSQIMTEKLGGIAYDNAASLVFGASYPTNVGCDTEVWLTSKEEDLEDELNDKEAEAYSITTGIKRLLQEFKVTDKITGELRNCQFKDIVILLRTNSGWDEIFQDVLTRQGIPSYRSSNSGYFSATEIQNLMQYLRVLNNPLQDIPLFGTMNSIFGGFTEEEISKIRIGHKKETLYESICSYEQEGEEELIREKISLFLEKLKLYREESVYLPVRKLLAKLIEDYDYLNYVTALPAGVQRKANVEMLLTKAEDYEKTAYYGLFHFIRYMEQLEKYDVDYGVANTLDEDADVVRIMSIHKSKGLEFPITIVAGLTKQFNMQDTAGALIMDADFGIGTNYVDPERRLTNKTLRKNVISEKMQLDNLAEELRILYVAMTRAKEKLILSGFMKEPAKYFQNILYLQNRKTLELGYEMLSSARNYFDYILAALMRHPCMEPVLQSFDLDANLVNVKDVPPINFTIYTDDSKRKEELDDLIVTGARQLRLDELEHISDWKNEQLYDKIKARFSFKYPYENLKDLYTKTTVSELKLAALEEKEEPGKPLFEEEIKLYIPAFRREKEEGKITGTTRGSAFHKVMEVLDFVSLLQDWKGKTMEERTHLLEVSLLNLVKEGKITEEYFRAVSIEKIEHFLSGSLAERMAKAQKLGNLYREQPFVYGISANRLKDCFPSEETVLIQGVIDVYFIENHRIVLLDYKTDVIQSESELMERYKVQLDYYKEALEHMWHIPVEEEILYSFYLEKIVTK